MEHILPYTDLEIVVTNVSHGIPRYDPRSADNACAPEVEYVLGDGEEYLESRHRITVRQGDDVIASRLLVAQGGCSSVHPHSAFVRGDTCFVAVGAFVCALALPELQLLWYTRADSATCFGVYDAPEYGSLISHGELEIARLGYAGNMLWASSGADIFTEGFELHDHHAEAIDFYGARHRVELATGEVRIIVDPAARGISIGGTQHHGDGSATGEARNSTNPPLTAARANWLR